MADADGITPGLKESLENTKCEYKRLGKTGLKISCPVMGAMSFGNAEWQPWVISASLFHKDLYLPGLT